MDSTLYRAFTAILKEEIVPAIGCKESVSLAFCASKAREVLGMQPTAVTVSACGSILKNIKNAVVPNTHGLKGVRAAVAAGIVCGESDKGMQVISRIGDDQLAAVTHFMDTVHIDVSQAETECPVYISVTLYARTSYSRVVIANSLTNIVEIMKNGEIVLKKAISVNHEEHITDRSCLCFQDIIDYADHVDLSDVKELLDMQITFNTAVCEEGLSGNYGTNIGRILSSEYSTDPKSIARAYVAAGCDARMSGCDLPVATLCGSGTQGIAASVPVYCYAKYYNASKDRLYRALLVSDLLTVYQNSWSGRLSSCCGAAFAGCASGAGIAYLLGESEHCVAHSLINSVSLVFETVCNGVNASCTPRVASAVESGIIGYQIYLRFQNSEESRDGIEQRVDSIIRGIENNISVGAFQAD